MIVSVACDDLSIYPSILSASKKKSIEVACTHHQQIVEYHALDILLDEVKRTFIASVFQPKHTEKNILMFCVFLGEDGAHM